VKAPAKKKVTALKPDEIRIPILCPMPACAERVPQPPAPFLRSLLTQYHELTKEGKKPEGRVHLLGKICSAITEHWEDGDDTTTAQDHGWPLDIEFEEIPERILVNFTNNIKGTVANEFVLNDSVAWKKFLTLLKGSSCNMAGFQGLGDWGKFHAVGTNAHAG
jgi:hypothetical protein